jgi:hypothetical protein
MRDRRQPNRLDTGADEQGATVAREEWIAIQDQMGLAEQEAIFGVE